MGRIMRQAAARTIFSYWQSIAPEAGVPARSAIDPRALKSHLPDLFILERMDRAVFAFRLAGTRLCARYGRELRDHDFVRLWPTADQGLVLEALHRCLQAGAPITLKGAAATLDGKTVSFDLMLLPLADDEGQATRVLGAMLPADDRALREGAIYVSQTLERVSASDDEDNSISLSSPAFAMARETRVSFLRVIDGAGDQHVAAQLRSAAGRLSDAV